jgi:hypothetical protein
MSPASSLDSVASPAAGRKRLTALDLRLRASRASGGHVECRRFGGACFANLVRLRAPALWSRGHATVGDALGELLELLEKDRAA